MSEILAICPSRGRPQVLKEMLVSFFSTMSPGTCLIVYLNDDDPKLPEYKDVIAPFVTDHEMLRVEVGPRKYIAEVFNEYFWQFPDFQYYMTMNDDHIYITPNWGEKLAEIVEKQGGGWGIAGADDYLTDWETCQHPSACVISGKMTRALGYIVWPKIRHIGIDTFQMKVAQGIKRLFLTRDVVIEHRHWSNGKRPMDDNYKWVYASEEQNHGLAAVQEYLLTQYHEDIKKINDAIAAEQK